ncbi:MAG TPA: SIS domain-containing protein [Acidimicrobiales bacterium]|nr:SIS domain-containing protein [Acidimicrobiales bacterium]
MPEQLAAAFAAAGQITAGSPFAAPTPTRAVVAFAQGTGALACEAAAALTANELAVPFVMVRGATAPRFVDDHTLAFSVSLPGEGDESSAAAAEAATRGAHVVTIGAAAEATAPSDAAHAARALSCALGASSTPRAELPAVTATVLAVLAECDLVPDPASSIAAAAGTLAARRDAWMAPGAAPEVLARRLGRTIPLVYGAEGPGAVAARWWKAGVNRNAKAPAFAASVPSVHFDELAGWGQSGDVTRQTMSLVLLRQPGEPASVAAHFAAVREATEEIMANVFEVDASGADDLARFFDLALLGELVSLHLAGREGVDPGPAPAVEESPGPPVAAGRAASS